MSHVARARDAVHKAAHGTAGYLTTEVRKQAREAGWGHMADSVEVRYDNGKFRYMWPDEHHEHVLDLEHGNASRLPTSVLHKHSNRIDTSVLVSTLWNHLGAR